MKFIYMVMVILSGSFAGVLAQASEHSQNRILIRCQNNHKQFIEVVRNYEKNKVQVKFENLSFTLDYDKTKYSYRGGNAGVIDILSKVPLVPFRLWSVEKNTRMTQIVNNPQDCDAITYTFYLNSKGNSQKSMVFNAEECESEEAHVEQLGISDSIACSSIDK